MNRFIKNTIVVLITGLIFFTLTSHRNQSANLEGLVVVANVDNQPLALTSAEFKKVIFGRKKRWPSGSKVYIALLKPFTPQGIKTTEQVFGMTPKELNSYWLNLTINNSIPIPKYFDYEDDLIKYLKITPGAIGVVSSEVDLDSKYVVEVKD